MPHPAAIRARIDEALAAKETGAERVILFNYCGHGFPDLSAYDDYLNGRLPDEQGGGRRRRAGRPDQHPQGAVSGSGAAAVVPVAVSTGKPSRIQYSIPPIISLTR
ncbi:MAG: tryptophan synthase beta chain [Pseudonocardia sp.]